MKATIKRSGCIGCGLCAANCPEVFVMDSDGLAQVRVEVTAELVYCAQEAADNCPVSVITLIDE